MANARLRIGVAGCGRAGRAHLARLLASGRVEVVACADPDLEAARALALAATVPGEAPVPAFTDLKELLTATTPDAVSILAPHRVHYRLAMDALQAGCHLFIEKPLSTNAQEADDIVGLARGRGRKVGVGHQYRLRPSLAGARRRIAEGAIGPLRLVTATLATPWLAAHGGPADAWRYEPKLTGGGILADVGDHLLDALLWTTGRSAVEVAAIQSKHSSGFDLVTAAAIRLDDDTPATFALSALSPGALFELDYFGETGRLRATDHALVEVLGDGAPRHIELEGPTETIDGNFVSAVGDDAPLCCPVEEALATVRLLEAIARSAASAQAVRLA